MDFKIKPRKFTEIPAGTLRYEVLNAKKGTLRGILCRPFMQSGIS